MPDVVGSLRSVLAGIRPCGGSLPFLQGLGEIIEELDAAGRYGQVCVYSQTRLSRMAVHFSFSGSQGSRPHSQSSPLSVTIPVRFVSAFVTSVLL